MNRWMNTGAKAACGLRRDIERSCADAVKRGDTRKLEHIAKALQGRIAEARGLGWVALAQSFEQDLALARSALDGLSLREAA